MRVVILIFALVAIATTAGDGFAQTVGVFADPQGNSTNISLTPGVEGSFYILATVEGEAAAGFAGVEFRVTGLPASWSVDLEPNPEAFVAWDDVFTDPGAVLAFSDCQTGTAGIVHLFTVTVIATNEVPSAILTVIKFEYQNDPELQCPVMSLCEPQNYELICANGGVANVDVEVVNDTCEQAIEIPWCSSFETDGNTMFMTDDYTPSDQVQGDGCTGRWAPGPDAVYRMELVAGLVVTATYWQMGSDGSLYIITDCGNPQGSCVVGADETGWNEAETIDWTVDTDGTYYLICDENDPAGGPYGLVVEIDCTVPTEQSTWGATKALYK